MLEESDYFMALGVDETGENEQSVADFAAQSAPDAPVGVETMERAEESHPLEEQPQVAEGAEQKPEMSPEERHQNAARRRKREVEAAVERARQEEREKFQEKEKSFFARAGLKNPYTDKPLENYADFEEWYATQSSKQMEKNLQEGRLTREDLIHAVEQLPVVQELQQMKERLARQQRQEQEQEFQQQVESELEQIRKLDPSVHNLSDILRMNTGPAFSRYVQEKGLSYLEAFELANAQQISQRRAEREKQRAVNAVASKRHLAPTGGNADNSLSVPKDVAALYRALDPTMSPQQIQREHNRWYGNHR